MTNEVGRAGFHVTHTKAVSERVAILDEMMRELSEESKARWAQRNPNIVVADEDLNIALVNDGEGGFDPCSDPKQVIAYGNARIAKLSSPIRDPKLDPVTGKNKGGTTTTSMLVLHLPKSLCEEVPDFYPVYDHDGKEVGRRSRWVARDRDEAVKYFLDSIRFLATHVIPGGIDAVLGADIQFSESTPHIQILADTFAPDPKHEGALRCDFSRAYGSHRDVRDDKGRQMSGQAKFRQYHEELKNFMLERGWDIEADVDPLRHDKTATKAVYGALKDQERALAEQEQNFAQNLAKGRSEIDAVVKELADEWENLYTERAAVESEREQLSKDKQKALEEARTQGYADGFKEAHTQGYAKGLEEGHSEVDALKAQASQKLDEANALVDKAAKQDEPMPLIQTRVIFKLATEMLADRLKKKGIRFDIVDGVKAWADGYVKTPGFEKDMQGAKVAYDRRMERISRDYEQIRASAQQLDSLASNPDDGPELG